MSRYKAVIEVTFEEESNAAALAAAEALCEDVTDHGAAVAGITSAEATVKVRKETAYWSDVNPPAEPAEPDPALPTVAEPTKVF